MRLHQALRGLLETAGVRAEAGMEVVGFQVEDGRVAWVETATSARPLKHRAKAFLVATGGILGGGITGDHSGRIWETALDLPLTIPPDRSRWFRPGFFDEAGQPVFQGGVAVDDHWQPVDDAGARLRQRLGRGQPAGPRRRHPGAQPGRHRRGHRRRRGAEHCRGHRIMTMKCKIEE
ncbi:MAG: hypothetical protein R2851_11675 [Caldilineaceae bacterium]